MDLRRRATGGQEGPAALALVLTGWSALTLQVLWQRVISLESGVDLASATTVVTAFLAGLGIGGLLGGHLADRLGPGGSRRALVAVNAALATVAFVSVPVIVAASKLIARFDAPPTEFVGYFCLLVVPTGLQGMLVPLTLRSITSDIGTAPAVAGRLTAWNTAGAVLGTMSAGWYLLGTHGFVNTSRIVGAANLLAALVVAVLVREVRSTQLSRPPPHDQASRERRRARIGWYAIYAMTGAIALGYEQVFIRVVDIIMRSNSYSFAHVLSLYLGAWASGAAVGARFVGRVAVARDWFFALQAALAITATGALVTVSRVLPATGLGPTLRSWFEGNGYTNGFEGIDGPRQLALFITFTILVPGALIALPAALAGATFPIAQRLVSDEVDTVGRRYGALTAWNIAGSVVGGVLVTYALLEKLGSAGTYLSLGAAAGAIGFGGLAASGSTGRWLPSRATRLAAVGALTIGLLVALPSNESLMAMLHGAENDRVIVAEDRSCASVAKLHGDEVELHINGSSQNGYPFDDFHVLIGLLPSLAHRSPERGLAVGLGIGSTSYGMLLDNRIDTVETIELCGGNMQIIQQLATPSRPELGRLTQDRRFRIRTADGRRHLAETDDRYDVITTDTLRPQAANSGSFYSVEYFTLARDRLADDGVFATWVPTGRALNGVAAVFPSAVALRFEEYFGSVFVLASSSPIEVDGEKLARRVARLEPEALSPRQRRSLTEFLSDVEPICITAGATTAPKEEPMINRDLHPRDEYFLNNPPVLVDPEATSVC